MIVCRNQDGELRAFYNTCRHRAAEWSATACGNRTAIHLPLSPLGLQPRRQARRHPAGEAYKTSYNPDPQGLDPVALGSGTGTRRLHARLVFVRFDDATAARWPSFWREAGDILQPAVRRDPT